MTAAVPLFVIFAVITLVIAWRYSRNHRKG
jgi:hypothetical protein